MKKIFVYFCLILCGLLLTNTTVFAGEIATYFYEVTGSNTSKHIETLWISKTAEGIRTTTCNQLEGCVFSLETTDGVFSLVKNPKDGVKTKIAIDKRSFADGYLYPRELGKIQESSVYINDAKVGTFRIMYLKKDFEGFDWYSSEMLLKGIQAYKSIEKRKDDVAIEEVLINQFGEISYKKLIPAPGT